MKGSSRADSEAEGVKEEEAAADSEERGEAVGEMLGDRLDSGSSSADG